MLAAHDFSGGFTDPVFDSQAVFRAVLDATAGPGAMQPLPDRVAPPAPLNASAGAILLALADADTPVFLDAALAASPSVAAWIAFHTGAPVVSAAPDATFAVISDLDAMPALSAFAQGSAEYPDRSATLVLQVASVAIGPAGLTLRGPGIGGSRILRVADLPDWFRAAWALNQEAFPLGVDILFAADGWVAALPRTAEIVEEASAPCM
jgi:alpha-D-ribose 1-methylphosphonate 5-triphosphate synthase subunit PhnH